MSQDDPFESSWYQFIREDVDDDLSGASVAAFMEAISRCLPVCEVAISNLEGAIFGLHNMSGTATPWADFMMRVSKADQYNWAFFFLFLTSEVRSESEERMMQLADATVRLVDSGYFYVYSRNSSFMKCLLAYYPDAEIKKLPFGLLEVPY